MLTTDVVLSVTGLALPSSTDTVNVVGTVSPGDTWFVVGTKTNDAQVDALVGRVRISGALDDAIAEAQAAVDRAKRHLESLPSGEPRDYLAAMADFVTARRS